MVARKLDDFPTPKELDDLLKACPTLPVFYLVMELERNRPPFFIQQADFSDPRKYAGVVTRDERFFRRENYRPQKTMRKYTYC